jgi:hypothetical protein
MVRRPLTIGICLVILAVCLGLVFALTPVYAEDVREGTVIKKDNLQEMLPKTFEGKTLGSMLPEKIQWMIQNHGLTITLRRSEEVPVDPRWLEATKKYKGTAKYDPKTRVVTGYQAGLAFPDLSESDSDFADKLMWNLYLTGGFPRPDFQYIPIFKYVMIDGTKGIDRSMDWLFLRNYMGGRLGGDKPVLGDGSIYYQQILAGSLPFDVRGLGSFAIRYTDGKLDDRYAYIKSVRRVRRLAGGAWFDPIGGTDQLNDEVSIYSAFPNWYPKYKVLGKRYILAVAHSRGVSWDEKNPGNEFPNIDLAHPPYWNPVNDWEPREVWVVEATMPEEHPYSKRIYYFDTKIWVPYIGECYDKRGEFVKMLMNDNRAGEKGMDTPTSYGVREVSGYTIDFRRMHATIFFQSETARRNPPGLGEKDVNVDTMQAVGEGKWKAPL